MTVYFIRAGASGPVKIGFSKHTAHDRLKALQTAASEELSVIREISGGPETESWLHKRFAAFRIRREWFEFDPDMLTIKPPPFAAINTTLREEAEQNDEVEIPYHRHANKEYRACCAAAERHLQIADRTEDHKSAEAAFNRAGEFLSMAQYWFEESRKHGPISNMLASFGLALVPTEWKPIFDLNGVEIPVWSPHSNDPMAVTPLPENDSR